jgi:hypothetical protein
MESSSAVQATGSPAAQLKHACRCGELNLASVFLPADAVSRRQNPIKG